MNKKATVIVWLSMVGLIIGVVTMLGLRMWLAPDDRPAYIGEQQLTILRADTQLGKEQFFVAEAAPFAVSAALFSLGQHGGFSQASASPCGQDGKIPVWAKVKANKYCIPEQGDLKKEFEKQMEQALRAYLLPLPDVPVEYAVVVETVQPGKMWVKGKARRMRTMPITIREKRAPIAQVGMNLSFATEVAYDFSEYETLATEVKTMVDGIRSCLPSSSKTLPKCVEEWLGEINHGPFLAQKRLVLHFDDCAYTDEMERDKLRSHEGGRYRFCALKNNGRTFLAHDEETGTIEERAMEYVFSIDFE